MNLIIPKVKMPKLALSSILIVLGLHIGNYIDQNLIDQMREWVWTSAIIALGIEIKITNRKLLENRSFIFFKFREIDSFFISI